MLCESCRFNMFNSTLVADYISHFERAQRGLARYFCTGDVGERRGPGEVKVIDRCKNHFKLAQGIFVAPDAWLKPSAELRATNSWR